MKKYLLPVVGICGLIVGLAAVFLLAGERQNLTNKASTNNGTATITLVPATVTHYPGQTFSSILKFNTSGAKISTLSVRLSYPYTGTTPALDIVDTSGVQGAQIYPDSGLTTSGDWAFPVKSVTRANGRVTVDLAAINTNINGYSNTSDTNLATIYFKVNAAVSTNPVVITFDTSASQILTKATPPVDILKTPVSVNYTITADTTAPTAIIDLKATNVSTSSATLTWTAPGDTGPVAVVSSYEVRYSTSTITSANWNSATLVSNPPAPFGQGVNQTLTVNGLTPDTTYYFAVVSKDTSGNVSNLSNILSFKTTSTCAASAPTLTLTPLSQEGSDGQALNYQLNIKNNNVGCTNDTFSIGQISLTHWTMNTNPSSFALADGENGNATVTLTPDNTIQSGDYDINITVSSLAGSTNVIAKYLVNNISTINFKFKAQGLTSASSLPSSLGRVHIELNTPGTNHTFYALDVDSLNLASTGIFQGSGTASTPGTYDIYIKEASHLRKKFANITLVNGNNNLDLTASPLLAGDFNNDNMITIADLSSMLTVYTSLTVPVTASNKVYDVNGDGVINIVDIALVLSNYTALQVSGD